MSEPVALPEDPSQVHYPESDGKPVGETPWHGDAMFHLKEAFHFLFRDDPDVYVGSNMFLYYREGDPRSCICPDVYVTRGMPKEKKRGVYKLWEEGVAPQLVVEVTSKSSQREDLWQKRALYEKLGVAEYLLFDPDGEYLEPRFQAFRLGKDGNYDPADLAEDGSYRSVTFGVSLRPEGTFLRVLDSGGALVPRMEEANLRALEATQRAQEEARRTEQEARRAEEAHGRAEEATQRAEEATLRAEEAESELRRLRERIKDPDA